MKKLLSLAFLLMIGVTFCMAQDTTKQTAVKEAKFNELKHHFGDIKQGKPVTTKFTFDNEGKKPLIIETAVASCGCTTPTYPKQPVLPGKTGEISVTYNAEASGAFTKMVTVKFAGYDRPVLLVIDGTVK
ncbi:Protein of unknown function [Arachidicoccus rhizosphaerae]|uniref:DUF1573 domain-containing protein n=1 Tax=Arachidicoccus rhizosphaerae TaxID=551991 RepID=A0A1H4CLS9_9BACT|nr:DUF1573 domain-containing protein [Arachidicoccus rhizosphaerae]SEA61270.1 Protein of unknown function [Arachidicoccus rhizosphaerae]